MRSIAIFVIAILVATSVCKVKKVYPSKSEVSNAPLKLGGVIDAAKFALKYGPKAIELAEKYGPKIIELFEQHGPAAERMIMEQIKKFGRVLGASGSFS